MQSIHQRVSKEYIAPEKLLNLYPKERTVYDFNQYQKRKDIFPATIYTYGDYMDGM